MAGFMVQWLVVAMVSLVHPHYVSTTTIEYNAADNNLEISLSVYPDDLEKSLKKIQPGRIDLLDATLKEQSDSLIRKYMSTVLQVSTNGAQAEMRYLGFEEDKGNIIVFFQVPLTRQLNTLVVKNTILYDTQKQQVNLVRLKYSGQSRSASLKYPESVARFEL